MSREHARKLPGYDVSIIIDRTLSESVFPYLKSQATIYSNKDQEGLSFYLYHRQYGNRG